MIDTVRDCPDCGTRRPFVQHHAEPQGCPDTADGRCSEWYCTRCGTALLIGLLPASRDVVAMRVRHAAGQLDRVA